MARADLAPLGREHRGEATEGSILRQESRCPARHRAAVQLAATSVSRARSIAVIVCLGDALYKELRQVGVSGMLARRDLLCLLDRFEAVGPEHLVPPGPIRAIDSGVPVGLSGFDEAKRDSTRVGPADEGSLVRSVRLSRRNASGSGPAIDG